jgi:hypothetical protein
MTAMVIISLKLSTADGWCVCRSHITFFSNMQLGPAITLARELARDEHRRSGRKTRVEMPGPDLPIVLALYAEDGASRGADALAA